MGIKGPVHAWLTSFLHQRTQRVLVDGEASDSCNVLSGVPLKDAAGKYEQPGLLGDYMGRVISS